MLIQLTDRDLAKMPPALHQDLLGWLQSINPGSFVREARKQQDVSQMLLDIAELKELSNLRSEGCLLLNVEGQDKSDRSHVRLS